ncbi:glycoside hydrolase family 2 protein [Candidatus Latescibacterota bacterium]
MRKIIAAILALLVCSGSGISADPGRWEQTISGGGWELRLDKDAEWIDDELFVSPPGVSALPVNPPSCGWDAFPKTPSKTVAVPGTVEQHYWSENGNPVGRAGDYRGVSWWSSSFHADGSLEGKRILIAFESVNLRAEVYVNRKLAGYDIIGNTPFEVDITDEVRLGAENRLDVRITDPGGNFTWPAHIVFPWGRNLIPIVRGFGGITGEVILLAVDSIRVEDIFVENTPKVKEANVHIAIENSADTDVSGTLTLTIHEYNNPENVLWKKSSKETIPPSGFVTSIEVKSSKAKVWDILKPNLYTASATFASDSGESEDTMNRRFGFRWFDIAEKEGDQRMYLNGRRIFMMANVHRGYWATNGIFPTPEMVKKDVEIAIKMGFNSIAYHNAVGHQLLARYADEYGLLATGESAGYRINDRSGKPVPDTLTRDWRREKLFRFVKRDRSYPSIIAYMLKNEDGNAPDDDDMANIARVREMDPTRILLYTGDCDRARREFADLDYNPLKLFYKPNDQKEYYYGWFDKHHWNRYPGYMDDWCYRNPRNYMRLNAVDGDSTTTVKADEIIFYGEEGAFGTTLTLGRIREQLYRQGSSDGWRENEHIDWYNAYDTFLDETGFRSSFPTVDDLTTALGANMHYFHGRIIENARMSNVIDAYNLNGWSAAGTHTDLVDAYRNPTGDPSVIAYYNQPLYVAVKIRDKVVPAGAEPVADIFLVNETGLKGKHTLELELIDPSGTSVFSETHTVSIKGGENFGQLLVEEVNLPAAVSHGYYTLNARIARNGEVKCTGSDKLFAVDYISGPEIVGNIAVIDTSRVIASFLKEARGVTVQEFTTWNSYSGPQMDCIIVGAHDFSELRRTVYSPVMEQVVNGATLIVIDNAESWAEQWDQIHEYQAIQYTGAMSFGSNGRFFVGDSPLLDGLPQSQSMNWEYQIFYRNGLRGLNMGRAGNETVVALASQSRKDIVTAVARIPFGRGQIIASTLDILPNLNSDMPQAAMAKSFFVRLVENRSMPGVKQ